MGGKVCLRCKAKHCWALSTNFWKKKVCWHHPAIFCLITSSKLFPDNLNFHFTVMGLNQEIFSNLFYFSLPYYISNFFHYIFRPGQEAQKIYKAVYPMDPTQVKTKLIGYGFSLLEGVDPNPDNYVCAGIIHTKTIQIGCLMRLEPNHSANVSINFGFKLYFFG